jgi:hypothetical protein
MQKTVQTNAKRFTVNQLTVNELRAWWKKIEAPGYPCDVTNEFMIPGISLDDLAWLCRCEVAEFEDLTYSELMLIADAAKELNPHLFRLRESLNEACAKTLELLTNAYTALADEACK